MKYTCELCDSSYQHGPGLFKGHKAHLYGIMVCDSCWNGNWDGWNPSFEEKLLLILKEKSLPVPKRRNDNGLLPRD